LLGIFGDDPGNIERFVGDLLTDSIVSKFSCDADRGRWAPNPLVDLTKATATG
jgi:hypothetical protein